VPGVLLLVLWSQGATANAVACSISCMLDLAHHQAGMDEGQAKGQHTTGSKLSMHCETPQLLVVAFVTPGLPTAPSITAIVSLVAPTVVRPVHSATPIFDTPPPRASASQRTLAPRSTPGV
jgi:hypothetical protein